MNDSTIKEVALVSANRDEGLQIFIHAYKISKKQMSDAEQNIEKFLKNYPSLTIKDLLC